MVYSTGGTYTYIPPPFYIFITRGIFLSNMITPLAQGELYIITCKFIFILLIELTFRGVSRISYSFFFFKICTPYFAIMYYRYIICMVSQKIKNQNFESRIYKKNLTLFYYPVPSIKYNSLLGQRVLGNTVDQDNKI